jgi:hypothetical protein
VLVAAVVAAAACGGGATGPAHPSRPPPLDRIERLLPPGAEWIVIARPAPLWAAAAVRRALTPVVGDADLTAYASRTGIHLSTITELAAAGYGARGTLAALGGPDVAKSIGQTLAIAQVPPFAYRRVHPDVALVASGAGAPALLVEGGRRVAPPIPATAADVTALREAIGDGPLQLLVLTPLELEMDTPAAVLLSGVRQAAVRATPRGAEIAFRVVLVGDFPPTAADNFRQMLDSMGDATIGDMFGLGDVARGARIEASTDRVTIDSAIAAASLASGIEALFISKLRELLGDLPSN